MPGMKLLPCLRRPRWAPKPVLPAMALGALFFIASLTPSLVPRDTAVQAVLSGLSLTAGYAIGLVLSALWRRLELPRLPGSVLRRVQVAVGGLCALAVAVALWRASDWQNGLRVLMDMPPVETVRPFSIAAGALGLFLLLLWFARLVRLATAGLSRRLSRVLPGPQAALVAVVLTAVLFWNIGNGVLVRGALTLADRTYAALDGVFEEASPRARRTSARPARRARCWPGRTWAGRAAPWSPPARPE